MTLKLKWELISKHVSIKKLFQVEKLSHHKTRTKKKHEACLIEFPNASKVFSECLCSDLAKFKWLCDLAWLWAKWLLTRNSYHFDMVRWGWHDFVLLFRFFFLRYCSHSLLNKQTTLRCLRVFIHIFIPRVSAYVHLMVKHFKWFFLARCSTTYIYPFSCIRMEKYVLAVSVIFSS